MISENLGNLFIFRESSTVLKERNCNCVFFLKTFLNYYGIYGLHREYCHELNYNLYALFPLIDCQTLYNY